MLASSFFHWLFHFHWSDKLRRLVETGGCPALFAVLVLSGMGLPLPEDIPLVIAGYFASQGRFSVVWVCIAAWTGIMGGDSALYWLGRRFGNDVTRIPLMGRHLNPRRLERVHVWFEQYGIWVVAVGRLLAGIRGAVVVVAGAIRFSFLKFFLADAVAAVVSGGLFIWLGFHFGKNHAQIEAFMHRVKGGALVVVALAAAVFGLVYLRRRRQAATAALPGFPVIGDEEISDAAAVVPTVEKNGVNPPPPAAENAAT